MTANREYVGRHRPADPMHIIRAERAGFTRDHDARWFGYHYVARHSADFPRPLALPQGGAR